MADMSIRLAGPEDVAGISNLFRSEYNNSSHPCKLDSFVAETIQSGRTLWQLVEDSGRIVGCMASDYHPWNRSWEIGRGIIQPEYRRAGLATALYNECISSANNSGLGDIFWAHPRNRTIANMCHNGRPPLRFVGHDGAINVANSEREYHTVVWGHRKVMEFQHIVPDKLSLAASPFVQTEIYAAQDMRPIRGPYPPAWIVGDGTSGPDLRPFAFGYNPRCPSDSIDITGYSGVSQNGRRIAEELLATLESFYHASHARLTVPVDKSGFIECLCANGFEITTYLPAWFHLGDERFDCVTLARTRLAVTPVALGLQDIVDKFRHGLNSVFTMTE